MNNFVQVLIDWKEIPTIATAWQEVERKGQYFALTFGGHKEYTSENSYCPDYCNRKKLNKEQTLDEWIKSKGL